MELSRGQQQHIVHWVPKMHSLKQIIAVLCGVHPDSVRAGRASLCRARCQPPAEAGLGEGPISRLPRGAPPPLLAWLHHMPPRPPVRHPHLVAPHLWKHIAFLHQMTKKVWGVWPSFPDGIKCLFHKRQRFAAKSEFLHDPGLWKSPSLRHWMCLLVNNCCLIIKVH